MMKFILILMLITVMLLLCVICGAVGFFLCDRLGRKSKPKTPPEADLKEIQAKEQAARELNNMLNYNGSEQEEFLR